MKKSMMIAAALAALVGAAGLALASDDDDKAKRLGVDVPPEQRMSIAQVTEKLTGQGYEVRKIESDDGVYEAYVIDQSGARLEVYVHPATGEILRQERK